MKKRNARNLNEEKINKIQIASALSAAKKECRRVRRKK